LPEERREIEAALSAGRVDVVVATSALELGVDIAGLDAAVLSGFPGTVASMWQQIGRSGRRGEASLAVVVAGEDQLDQWVVAHPRETMSRSPEPAVVNPSNPLVLDAHLACAAQEQPLCHADEELWGDDVHEGVRRGVLADRLDIRRRRYEPVAVFSGRGWPAAGVSLRSSSSGELDILDATGTRIGTIDAARAVEQTHPGAVYLHQGRAFLVTRLDLDERTVWVEPCDGTTYTQPVAAASMTVVERHGSRSVGALSVVRGTVEVTRQVTGYRVRRCDDHALLGVEDLDLPAASMVTTATWTVFPSEVVGAALTEGSPLGPALHAIEHAAIGILPLFALCDRSDVGGMSTEHSPDTGAPTVFLHDAHPGGAGVAPLACEVAEHHLAATLGVIERCRCATGCPSCVHSPRCGTGNEPLDKAGAARLLRAVLHRSATAA
jgi:DEAD/DEAH box helicase domain-containing protein